MRKISQRNKKRKCPRICMITGPLSDSIVAADIVHISSLLRLLEPQTEAILIISSNLPENIISNEKINIKNIKHRSNSKWMFIRIPMYIRMELKISYQLFKIQNKIDIVFFSIGAVGLVLPMISAKLMQKKIIFICLGKDTLKRHCEVVYKEKLFGLGGRIFPLIASILEMLNYRLSDKIIANSSNIAQFVLKRYRNKISIISRFFIDENNFKIENDIGTREVLIGYVGKFDEVKGIINFKKAIPLISESTGDVKFILCGDGTLRDNIEMEIKDTKLDDIVTITGWISYDKLPQYLNEMKLVVIPSYYEAGPQLLFEAMACGTPVLATPVGVVHDVIKDGETGFIMENNSPKCIAENVKRAINYPDLDRIVKNARKLIEEEYTYEAAVERYRKIFGRV